MLSLSPPSAAFRWESPSQTSSWLSPSRLCPLELGSPCDLGDLQQNIRRGGSRRSLQLDYRLAGGYGGNDGLQGRGQEEAERRTFQWERNQSGKWERKCTVEGRGPHGGEGRPLPGGRGSSCEDVSSPVYEEYRESSPPGEDTESLYDTLPPTRPAYEGYPPGPPGVHLHPAQLLPPLRAWDSQTAEWRGSQEDSEGLGSGSSSSAAGSGDELERLLNLVSLRARRATRISGAPVARPEPAAADWDGFN